MRVRVLLSMVYGNQESGAHTRLTLLIPSCRGLRGRVQGISPWGLTRTVTCVCMVEVAAGDRAVTGQQGCVCAQRYAPEAGQQ